jgi:hypothetical protein
LFRSSRDASQLHIKASHRSQVFSFPPYAATQSPRGLDRSNLAELREAAAERRSRSRRFRALEAELLRQEDHRDVGSSSTELEGRVADHRRHPRQRPRLRPPTSTTNCVAFGEHQQKPSHTHGWDSYAYLLDMVFSRSFTVCRVAGEQNSTGWHQHSSTLHNSDPHKPNIESVPNALRNLVVVFFFRS